jgi:hypothetical protein
MAVTGSYPKGKKKIKLQRLLTTITHEHNHIIAVNRARDIPFLAVLMYETSQPSSHAWMKAYALNSTLTIPNHNFSLILRFHCGLAPSDTIGPSCQYGHDTQFDKWECLTCVSDRRKLRTKMHDSVVKHLSSSSTLAGRPSNIEPRLFNNNRSRPDFTSHNYNSTEYGDVCIVHSSTPSRLELETRQPGTSVRNAAKAKIRKYANMMLQVNGTLIPVALTTHCAMSKPAIKFIRDLSQAAPHIPSLLPSAQRIQISVLVHNGIANIANNFLANQPPDPV